LEPPTNPERFKVKVKLRFGDATSGNAIQVYGCWRCFVLEVPKACL
jgi:hypothetical protein